MKYYGYIQDSTKDNTITNNLAYGYYTKFSNDKDKLINHLIEKLRETHSEKWIIEECSDLLNGESKIADGWCQMFTIYYKSNLRNFGRRQICVWAIEKEDII